jgi:ferric-dicitrate binding protein FerR (iron transport regulator)
MSDARENSPLIDEIIDREQRGQATPAELRQIVEWRRASLANEHEYRRLVKLLSVAHSLPMGAASPRPTAAALLARAREPRHPERSEGSLSPRAEPSVPPASRRWIAWMIPVAAAAGLIAGFIVPRASAPSPAAPSTLGVADISTGAAEMTTVQLGDGSVVRLAPASHLRVAQSDSTREVTLDGRAFFVVAKMPDRPFVVHTPAGSARVLGTRFELATTDKDLRLVVVEGRVALTAGTNRVEVAGGEQSGVRNQQTLTPTPVADASKMEQWVGKFLVFQSTPLRDAAREIERVYGARVSVSDSVLARQTVQATFVDKPLAQLVDEVCTLVNARCETRQGEVVISRR